MTYVIIVFIIRHEKIWSKFFDIILYSKYFLMKFFKICLQLLSATQTEVMKYKKKTDRNIKNVNIQIIPLKKLNSGICSFNLVSNKFQKSIDRFHQKCQFSEKSVEKWNKFLTIKSNLWLLDISANTKLVRG